MFECAEFLDGKERLGLPDAHVPQLEEVSDLLEPLTGFRYQPAAGLVPLREFYGTLADKHFWSTQYVRHHSVPLYTPEPDVLHEVVGHGNTLANDRYAALYVSAGRAAHRLETPEPLDLRAMGTTDYDITVYQHLLYAAASFTQVEDVVGAFWDTCSDDSIAALRGVAA